MVLIHTTSNQQSNSRTEYYPSSVFTFGFFCSNIVFIVFPLTAFGFDVLIVNRCELMLLRRFLVLRKNGFVSPLSHFLFELEPPPHFEKMWQNMEFFSNKYMANQQPNSEQHMDSLKRD